MKILFLLLGTRNQASSRVRGFWVMEELERLGIQCSWNSESGVFAFLKCCFLILSQDCVVLQKRYGRWDYYLLKIATFLRKQTVIDLDDKYSKSENKTTLNNLVRIMQSASAVTVGSPALLDFAVVYQPKSYLLPTSVKLKNYQPAVKAAREPVVLGWIGNGRHYHTDLIHTLKGPLEQVSDRHVVKLKLVGACGQKDLYDVFGAIPGLETEFVDELNWSDQGEVLCAIADFDIGLCPLEDNDFNRYKCGFKALEYMALGIPVISSPVGANCDIISNGVEGYLVDDARAWTEAISALVANPELRKSMGSAGRAKVEQQYDVRSHARALAILLGANVSETS